MTVGLFSFNCLTPDAYRIFRFRVTCSNPHQVTTPEDTDPTRAPDAEETHAIIEVHAFLVLTEEEFLSLGNQAQGVSDDQWLLKAFEKFWTEGTPPDQDAYTYMGEEEDEFVKRFILQQFSRRMLRGRILDANGFYMN